VNVLISPLYDLGNRHDLFLQMRGLCAESYCRNLRGMDDHVVMTGTFDGGEGDARAVRNHRYGEMLVDMHWRVRALWEAGNDVLLVDGDTLCVRPTPWPGGDEFRMFNMACARVPYGAFPEEAYLHSGVRYFPASMDPAAWTVADELVGRWDFGEWAYDQYVWNAMYWAQPGKRLEDARAYVDPRYCWCAQPQYDNLGVPRSEAYIVHYHGTRGLEMCLRRMRRDA